MAQERKPNIKASIPVTVLLSQFSNCLFSQFNDRSVALYLGILTFDFLCEDRWLKLLRSQVKYSSQVLKSNMCVQKIRDNLIR